MPQTQERAGTTLSTYVPRELALDVRRLAVEGDRSVSREVGIAVREYVARRTVLIERQHPKGEPS
jgi:hypothetical protein